MGFGSCPTAPGTGTPKLLNSQAKPSKGPKDPTKGILQKLKSAL